MNIKKHLLFIFIAAQSLCYAKDEPVISLTITDSIIDDTGIYIIVSIENRSSEQAHIKKHQFCSTAEDTILIKNDKNQCAIKYAFYNFGNDYFYSKKSKLYRYTIDSYSKITCPTQVNDSYQIPSSSEKLRVQATLSDVYFNDKKVAYTVNSNIFEIELHTKATKDIDFTNLFSEEDLTHLVRPMEFRTPGQVRQGPTE